jgi:hypothetical protein
MREELSTLQAAAGEQLTRPADQAGPVASWIPVALALLALGAAGLVLLVPWGEDLPQRLDPQAVVLASSPDTAPIANPDVTAAALTGAAAAHRADAGERITLVVQPSVPDARVIVDGKYAGTGAVRLQLPRSKEPVQLEIRARHHATYRRVIVPDRDQTLPVELAPYFRPGRRLGLERNPYGPEAR